MVLHCINQQNQSSGGVLPKMFFLKKMQNSESLLNKVAGLRPFKKFLRTPLL